MDDDERNLLAVRTVLEDVGEVVTATSGEEALRHLLRGEFAVILLDVYMPGMDGYETAQIIRSREQTKRIPIVFLSAVNKEAEHLIRGYAMGAVDYVFKPVEPIVLQSKVAVFVDLFLKTREIQRKADAEQRLLDANLQANAELLRAEQELRAAEQRQAAILRSLPILLYAEPVSGYPRVPHYLSGDFEGLTGYAFPAVENNPQLFHDRLHPDDRDRVEAALVERARTGSMAIEYRWRTAGGEYKHLLDQGVVLRGEDGEATEFAGTMLDVTERRSLESQLVQASKMDAIGQLTGGIAHDFNNLLAAVLGGLRLIDRRVPLDEGQRKIVAMTQHAAEQGTELVARLLAFARRQKLEPARVPVDKLSQSVRELLAHTLGGLVVLDWQVGDDAWCAYADEAQLELALMNLIINARDAMPDGGTVTAYAENRIAGGADVGLPRGDYLVIGVSDTGTGIPADILQQVLEPFFTTKPIGKGTGLGLSMVYGFAKQSGGAMTIHSRVGDGTRVEIWLPRAPAEPDQNVGSRAARPIPDARSRPGLRVLLVDDHQGVRATTAALLQDMGHSVVDFGSGPEMLSRLEASPDDYDLIVTDYAMPGFSGTEVIHRARMIRPDMPSIIVTGYADTQAIAKRPDDVLVVGKPFSHDALDSAIASVCAMKVQAAGPLPGKVAVASGG
ncbi:response regulator [Sphingomonas bacterium]|uniref:response regulator n=1 Tax=Sphingomonas bacterium TaxID=1895847 RepID=UPI00260FA848|nr:response regulator [Sphingomonas bacterium]